MAELKYDIIPENAPRFAADMVATLDYSVESLEQVDQIIGGFHDEGVAVEEVEATVFGFGCYVGEVFVRHAGAKWLAPSPEDIDEFYGVPLIVELNESTTANPIGKVIKRLENGDEDNLPYFYRAMMNAAYDTSHIVFFDGVCGFCNASVNWLLCRDRHRRLVFSPLQGETAQRLLTPADVQNLHSLVLWTPRGVYRKSSAAVRLAWTLGGIFAVFAALLWLVPLPLRNWGYDVIAKRRYRILGQRESCRVPSAEERARFLP
jgi:predicted DCC family thiol-disulfide oxidoreductase YuxK